MDDADLTDLDTVPAIAMTQWHAGRVLSDADVAMIADILAEQDILEAETTEAFHRGRKEAFFEIGGQELVDAVERGDLVKSEISLKKAYAAFAAKEAELKSMNMAIAAARTTPNEIHDALLALIGLVQSLGGDAIKDIRYLEARTVAKAYL